MWDHLRMNKFVKIVGSKNFWYLSQINPYPSSKFPCPYVWSVYLLIKNLCYLDSNTGVRNGCISPCLVNFLNF